MKYDGMDERLFQTPMRLHLTLGMLTILDISEQAKVIGTLQDFIRKEIRYPIAYVKV
jgi:Na+-translocating ferredoxin:NAD+ oxidoreductase RnfE subunit